MAAMADAAEATPAATVTARVEQSFAVVAGMQARLRVIAAAAAKARAADTTPAATVAAVTANARSAPAAEPAGLHSGRSSLDAVRPASRPRPVGRRAGEFARCSRFRTFDAASNTYRGFDGMIHACRPEESRGAQRAASAQADTAAHERNAAVAQADAQRRYSAGHW
jgi:hypothetical protein